MNFTEMHSLLHKIKFYYDEYKKVDKNIGADAVLADIFSDIFGFEIHTDTFDLQEKDTTELFKLCHEILNDKKTIKSEIYSSHEFQIFLYLKEDIEMLLNQKINFNKVIKYAYIRKITSIIREKINEKKQLS